MKKPFSKLREKLSKLNSLDKYVIFSIFIVLVFTVAEFVTSTITGVEHSTLCAMFFGCFGGEVLSCALIKIFKLKEENDEE